MVYCKCVVKGCTTNSLKKSITLFDVPTNESIFVRWREKIAETNDGQPLSIGSKVCELHFHQRCIRKEIVAHKNNKNSLRSVLSKNAVPSLNLTPVSPVKKDNVDATNTSTTSSNDVETAVENAEVANSSAENLETTDAEVEAASIAETSDATNTEEPSVGLQNESVSDQGLSSNAAEVLNEATEEVILALQEDAVEMQDVSEEQAAQSTEESETPVAEEEPAETVHESGTVGLEEEPANGMETDYTQVTADATMANQLEEAASISNEADLGTTVSIVENSIVSIADPVINLKDVAVEAGKLDVLVCGNCHTVFHFIEEFQTHKNTAACNETSSLKSNIIEPKPQVWAFLIWKNSQIEDGSSWKLYQRWCQMSDEEKSVWIAAGARLQECAALSRLKNVAKGKQLQLVADTSVFQINWSMSFGRCQVAAPDT